MNRDAGQPTDKRVRILVAQIKELIGENLLTNDTDTYAEWVDTSQMLADILTKLNCEREPILHAPQTGQWRLAPREEAKLRKARVRAGRQARKVGKKVNQEAEDGCENPMDHEGTNPPNTSIS